MKQTLKIITYTIYFEMVINTWAKGNPRFSLKRDLINLNDDVITPIYD